MATAMPAAPSVIGTRHELTRESQPTPAFTDHALHFRWRTEQRTTMIRYVALTIGHLGNTFYRPLTVMSPIRPCCGTMSCQDMHRAQSAQGAIKGTHRHGRRPRLHRRSVAPVEWNGSAKSARPRSGSQMLRVPGLWRPRAFLERKSRWRLSGTRR